MAEQWNAAPKEDKGQPVGYCYASACGKPHYEGQDILYDSRVGEEFCNEECLKTFYKEDAEATVDDFLSLLRKTGDIYTKSAK